VDILLGHVADIYAELPAVEVAETEELLPLEEKFLTLLPDEFNNQVYLKIASEIYVSSRTAHRYIKNLTKTKKINKLKHNHYEKSKV
jgi:hypothetical protein